jgi:hypothetical protein
MLTREQGQRALQDEMLGYISEQETEALYAGDLSEAKRWANIAKIVAELDNLDDVVSAFESHIDNFMKEMDAFELMHYMVRVFVITESRR